MGHIQRITGLNTPEQLRAHLSRIGARLPVSEPMRLLDLLAQAVSEEGGVDLVGMSDSKRGARGAPRKE